MVINAIIWDMDGVISDTQRLHATIESELLARYGIKMSAKEITKKYAGVRTADFFLDLLTKKGAMGFNIDELMSEKWKRATELVDEVDAIPGAIKLVKEAFKKNIPQAVASASGKKYVNAIIEELGIKKYFKAIITGDQVRKGKPDPEIFLKAAKSLKVNPAGCLVIEDGGAGMIGAKNAGMKCIGLVYDNKKYPVNFKTNDLRKITIDKMLLI